MEIGTLLSTLHTFSGTLTPVRLSGILYFYEIVFLDALWDISEPWHWVGQWE